MKCDQCQMASINGVACHETGCPNSRKTWVEDRGEWVRFVECRECGCDVEEGESCDCMDGAFDLCSCGREPNECTQGECDCGGCHDIDEDCEAMRERLGIDEDEEVCAQ